MNSEKKNAVKKEQKSPAPLPMYRPVVLRHVPTMVRRRYDHPQDDSKNESEEAEAAEDPSASVSEMDDTETEHDILASLGTEHDTEEFGSSDFGSNTSLQLISEGDHETKKDTDVCSCQVLNEANDEVKNKELGNLYNQDSTVILAPKKAMTDCRSPLPLPSHPVVLKHVPTVVRRTYDSDLQKFDAIDGLHSEDGKSDGDGAEDDNHVHFVDDYLDDDQDGCKSTFSEVKDDVASYVDASAQNEVMADEQGMKSEKYYENFYKNS
ncbi:unnamed protein product [Amaranthus hypochondriacus]